MTFRLYPRFNNEFRQAELWVYKQKEKTLTFSLLKHHIKPELINELITQGIIEKKRGKYLLKDINEELFVKAVEEEKILIKELSQLYFGEVEEAQVEALDIVLQRVNDKQGFIKSVLKSYEDHSLGVTNLLKDYRIIPSRVDMKYPSMYSEDRDEEIKEELSKIKVILENEVNHEIDKVQMKKVLVENDKYITKLGIK